MILLDQAGAGSSAARLFSPSRALEPFVEHFWTQNIRSSPSGSTWRVVPDANPHLIFVLARDNSGVQARCNVVGPRARFADVAMANRILTCGVRLRAGALPVLTGFPASDLTDRSVPVENVFGARGALLMERLRESQSSRSALGIMAGFLRREGTGRSYAVQLPLGRCSRVDDMAAQSGLPVRTLRARVMQHVGLSPKRLLRIERLHRALASVRDRSLAWSHTADRAGFADQAHMIREFHDLLGESPTRWTERARLPICSRQ